jgi:hypothetical protein
MGRKERERGREERLKVLEERARRKSSRKN